ncbi:hypothetical protein C0995_004046 [Termitomyces sp. Mi166|nr:hypothetical protein C0995_004046 [Termitomyces sp. Mi166\
MSSKYSLRNQQPRRPSHPFSPSAVHHTGPLQCFRELEGTELTPVPDMPTLEQCAGTSTSADNAVMPTVIDVDAAKLQAGENTSSLVNGSPAESSLTSSVDNSDNHCYVPIAELNVVVDQYTDDSMEYQTHRMYIENVPEEDDFGQDIAEACNNMTHNNYQTGEPLQGKGKNVEPCNWGNIDLDEPKCDPQNPEPNIVNTKVRDVAVDMTTPQNEETNTKLDDLEVLYQDVLEYLCNKKKMKHEIDCLKKNEKTSHKKKDCAESELLSNELAMLIQKVAESSQRMHKYKLKAGKKALKDNHKAATKPITQITLHSALGRAFECLGKH